ncbi:unnamed protein product [Brassica oleracea var. botrytis]
MLQKEILNLRCFFSFLLQIPTGRLLTERNKCLVCLRVFYMIY